MFMADHTATITRPSPMNYFFESLEDYAANGGVITDAVRDAYLDPCDAWEESFVTSAAHETYEDAEYREDRYEQMASRHGCWCILTAKYTNSATYSQRYLWSVRSI